MECIPQLTLYNTFITFCFTIIFILSLLGNWAAVLAISKHEQRSAPRSITNVFLLNLAIADLLRSMICIPPTLLSEISRCWLLGPYVCKFAAYLQPVAVCASAYTLAVIALERYYAICRPLESRSWLSKRRSLVLILFVWLIAFAGNIGALVIYDAVPYKTHWSCQSTASSLADFIYQIHVTLLLLLVPLTVMLCLYYKIIKTLHSDKNLSEMEPTNECLECNQSFVEHRSSLASWFCSSNKEHSNKALAISFDIRLRDLRQKDPRINPSCNAQYQQVCSHSARRRSFVSSKLNGSYDCGYMLRSNRQEKIIEAKRRVTRMLIIIVVSFVVCWTPSFIWWLAVRISDLVRIRLWNRTVNTYITLLTYISTCTNPITYCLMNERFRRNILAHFWCCPFQICKRSLQPKLAPKAYSLHRPNFPDHCNEFIHANNLEEVIAATPFISGDN